MMDFSPGDVEFLLHNSSYLSLAFRETSAKVSFSKRIVLEIWEISFAVRGSGINLLIFHLELSV